MMFIISFTLSLLALTAGLHLLNKAKQDTGKFMKIMSWIIIAGGILAVLLSIQLAIFKCIAHKNHEFPGKDKLIYFHDKLPFEKFIPFGDFDDDDFSCADDESDNMKVIIKKETTDSDFDPEEQKAKQL